MKEKYLILFWVAFVTAILIANYINSYQPYYTINLINQTTVEIHSHSSGKTYVCSPEEIVEILEKDNK